MQNSIINFQPNYQFWTITFENKRLCKNWARQLLKYLLYRHVFVVPSFNKNVKLLSQGFCFSHGKLYILGSLYNQEGHDFLSFRFWVQSISFKTKFVARLAQVGSQGQRLRTACSSLFVLNGRYCNFLSGAKISVKQQKGVSQKNSCHRKYSWGGAFGASVRLLPRKILCVRGVSRLS